MATTTFPLPVGSAARWAAYQVMRLREEGFGCAVLDTVQPMFFRYARTGDDIHMREAQRLLQADL